MTNLLKILLIEDDGDDVELLQDSFTNNGVKYAMHVINDGGKVADYLEKNTDYPNIIVMDLNLPKVHGKEILKLIKSKDAYAGIPLVVLTTSSSAEDKKYTLEQGATSYLTKPTTSKGLYEVVSVIAGIAGHI